MADLRKKQEMLISLKDELANCGRSKSQLLIDDDDEYQDQLELSWHKSELRDQIDTLEREILYLKNN